MLLCVVDQLINSGYSGRGGKVTAVAAVATFPAPPGYVAIAAARLVNMVVSTWIC